MTKLPRKGEYWVNEAETILVCMLADTPSAKAIRAELIEIVMAWRRRRLLPREKASQFLKLMAAFDREALPADQSSPTGRARQPRPSSSKKKPAT